MLFYSRRFCSGIGRSHRVSPSTQSHSSISYGCPRSDPCSFSTYFTIRLFSCYMCPETARVVGAPILTSATIFCHLWRLWRSSAALWLLLKSQAGPLFDVVLSSFLLPSSFSFPGTVPCTIFLQRPLGLTTCPYHRSSFTYYPEITASVLIAKTNCEGAATF